MLNCKKIILIFILTSNIIYGECIEQQTIEIVEADASSEPIKKCKNKIQNNRDSSIDNIIININKNRRYEQTNTSKLKSLNGDNRFYWKIGIHTNFLNIPFKHLQSHHLYHLKFEKGLNFFSLDFFPHYITENKFAFGFEFLNMSLGQFDKDIYLRQETDFFIIDTKVTAATLLRRQVLFKYVTLQNNYFYFILVIGFGSADFNYTGYTKINYRLSGYTSNNPPQIFSSSRLFTVGIDLIDSKLNNESGYYLHFRYENIGGGRLVIEGLKFIEYKSSIAFFAEIGMMW